MTPKTDPLGNKGVAPKDTPEGPHTRALERPSFRASSGPDSAALGPDL